MRRDLLSGWRIWRKRPFFSLTLVVTLSLGIGAMGAAFAMVSSIYFLHFPIEEPQRVVLVWASNPSRGLSRYVASREDFQQWAQADSLRHLTALSQGEGILQAQENSQRVSLARTSPNLFALAGRKPRLGRSFADEDGRPGAPSVALISEGLWHSLYGGDSGVLGETLRLDGQSYEIIGVAPADFWLIPGQDIDLWTNLDLSATQAGERSLLIAGRLAESVQLPASQRELDALAQRLSAQRPETHTGWGARLTPLPDELRQRTAVVLGMLQGGAAFLFLIVCVNVGGVVLVRVWERRREMAMRTALGASRKHLCLLAMGENAALALPSAGFGLAFAAAGAFHLRNALMDNAPFLAQRIAVGGEVVLAVLGMALFSVLLLGLPSALRALRAPLSPLLRSSAEPPSAGRLWGLLVSGELALAVMLLASTVLLARSVEALEDIDLGFDPRGLVTLRMSPQPGQAASNSELAAFWDSALISLQSLPEVSSVSAVNRRPLMGGALNATSSVLVQGGEDAQEQPIALVSVVSTDYFNTLSIPLLSGRGPQDVDRLGSRPVAWISQTAANRLWPGRDPLAGRFRLGDEEGWISVAGIVGDVINDDRDAAPPPQVYLPLLQRPRRDMALMLRCTTGPSACFSQVRQRLRAFAPEAAIYDLRTQDEILRADMAGSYFIREVLSFLAAVSLIVAALGLYGLTARWVSSRGREFGIRLALGSTPRQLLRKVLYSGLWRSFWGLLLGSAGAYGLARLLGSQLYGVSPYDPISFIATALILLAAALLAALFPSWRASRTDPIQALRTE